MAVRLLVSGCVAVLPACSQFVRVPPGQSVRVAMAKRPEVIAYPAPALPSGGGYTGEWGGGEVLGSPPVAVPETVADYFMLGTTALQEGRNGDAIEAFERAVEIDPDFPEAWNHLAICYQNNGQEARAIEAFRRYKAIAAR